MNVDCPPTRVFFSGQGEKLPQGYGLGLSIAAKIDVPTSLLIDLLWSATHSYLLAQFSQLTRLKIARKREICVFSAQRSFVKTFLHSLGR